MPASTFSPQIDHAAELLVQGQLVAFPTETVYGLGADASQPEAVAAIYLAKGRPSDHPVIVHLAVGADPAAWAAPLSSTTEGLLQQLIERFWPGPLTLILPRGPGVADAVTGGQDSVGLRCPAHPMAQSLLQRFTELTPHQTLRGIAAPSANRFGRISPTTAQHVREEFGDAVHILDGGACPVGIESTILDLTRTETLGPVLLRPGSITAAMLSEELGAAPLKPDRAAPRASGTLAAHYAPTTPLVLMDKVELAAIAEDDIAVWTRTLPLKNKAWLRAPNDAAAYAHELYGALRRMDALRLRQIIIECPPNGPEWAAIQDRLMRAASRN